MSLSLECLSIYISGIIYRHMPGCFLNSWHRETIAKGETVLSKLNMSALIQNPLGCVATCPPGNV